LQRPHPKSKAEIALSNVLAQRDMTLSPIPALSERPSSVAETLSAHPSVRTALSLYGGGAQTIGFSTPWYGQPPALTPTPNRRPLYVPQISKAYESSVPGKVTRELLRDPQALRAWDQQRIRWNFEENLHRARTTEACCEEESSKRQSRLWADSVVNHLVGQWRKDDDWQLREDRRRRHSTLRREKATAQRTNEPVIDGCKASTGVVRSHGRQFQSRVTTAPASTVSQTPFLPQALQDACKFPNSQSQFLLKHDMEAMPPVADRKAGAFAAARRPMMPSGRGQSASSRFS